jgi:hypothetical protein
MGVGVIVWDDAELVLVSMCTTAPFIFNPTVAEAVAAWKAVVFCCELAPTLIVEKEMH